MAEYKVEWVEIQTKNGKISVPAERIVCPICKTLDLGTAFDSTTEPMKALCPEGHEWEIKTRPEA